MAFSELTKVGDAVYKFPSGQASQNYIWQKPAPQPYEIYRLTPDCAYTLAVFELPPEAQFSCGVIRVTYTLTIPSAQSADCYLSDNIFIVDKDVSEILVSPYDRTRRDGNHNSWFTPNRGINDIYIPAGQTQKVCTNDFWITNGYSNSIIYSMAGIMLRNTTTYIAGGTVSDLKMSYEHGGQFYKLTPTYPVNVNVKATANNIFTWTRGYDWDAVASFYVPQNIKDLFDLDFQDKHTIKYKKNGTGTEVSLTEEDANFYQAIPANTFEMAEYEYKVVNYYIYDDFPLESEAIDFNVIGPSAAPTINSVTNDSIPLISWTDVNQEAYEVRIKDLNQKVIYDSGIIAGTNQSFRLPMMLADGTYVVEVREINTFGFYSEWGSLEFTINPAAVNAPTDIFATTNNKYGVEISGTPDENAQKTYVVRRKVGSDDVEILGEYTGGIFTDYTAEGNTFYEYTLRNYNYAYNDGFWIPIQVKVKQVVIRDGRNPENFIPLDKSEQENFGPQWTEDADRVLFNCLGRRYPVKEVGEWVNSLRTFSAYVHNRDLKRLLDMVLNAAKVYYMADGEYFACDMAIEDQGTYNQNGRIIDFTMTRIADDESVSII